MNRMTRVVSCALLCWGAIRLLPHSARADELKSPYKVVCTTGMVADIVSQVAGSRAEVESIIGAGVDPHLYQATRTDIAKLIRADVIFYSGLMLEGKMGDALLKVGRERPVYAVTELIPVYALTELESTDATLLVEPGGVGGHVDPHLWMDVSLWKQCAEMVARTLAGLDAPHAEEYTANFNRYAAELDRLHAYVGEVLSSVPSQSRVLVTAHDAFNYMGRAYGLDVRGIQGLSTESEAGIADINTLVDLLVTRDIKAVFVESSVSDKNVRSLLEGAASRGHTVTIGGTLYSDAMGKPGTYEGTYIGMIDHNATTIAKALGGTPPPGGMNGKLVGGS